MSSVLKAPITIIAGPTASGKSSYALNLAQEHQDVTGQDAVILNADSMQVYHGLPILTAQPSDADMQLVEHRLYGFLNPEEKFSVGNWLSLIVLEIKQLIAENKKVLVVGGTGMYLKCLINGIANIPDSEPKIRTKVQEMLDENGIEVIFAELEKVDPVTAKKIDSSNKQRVCRALEVYIQTGKPLSWWQAQEHQEFFPADYFHKILILPERAELYEKCNLRFAQMIEHGALEEAKMVINLDLSDASSAIKILGLKELMAYLRDEMGLEEAISLAQQSTRRYAKRQITWFKNQFAGDDI